MRVTSAMCDGPAQIPHYERQQQHAQSVLLKVHKLTEAHKVRLNLVDSRVHLIAVEKAVNGALFVFIVDGDVNRKAEVNCALVLQHSAIMLHFTLNEALVTVLEPELNQSADGQLQIFQISLYYTGQTIV